MNTVAPRGSILRPIRNLLNRPFFVLLGGAGFAQLISFASSPLLSRLYPPEAFGLLSLFGTSLAVIGAVAGGRYEQAIIGETNDELADRLVVLVALFSSVLAIFLPFILPTVLRVIGAPNQLLGMITYLSPAVFGCAVGQALMSWLIRRGAFPITSATKIVQALVVLSVALCLIGTTKGLVIASMTGYLVTCLSLGFGAWRLKWLRSPVTFQDLWVLIRRHIRFPIIGVLPALFDSLSMLLPVYWVAINFSAADTGQFGLSRQVLAAPLGMVSLVVSQLLMKRLADANSTCSSMVPALRSVLLMTAGPIFAGGIVVSSIAPDLFAWVFGKTWSQAGLISRWMVWAYIVPMLVSPLSSVLIVLRRVAANGLWQMLHCGGLILIVSFGNFANLDIFVRVLVIFELFSYASYAVLIAYATNEYEKSRHA